MLTWDYYRKIRNVNLKAFIERREIENYDGLVQTLENLGVESPSLIQFQNAYTELYPPVKTKKQPIKSKPTVSKQTESNEPSEAQPVPQRKKRTYRRKKTSKTT